MRNLKKFLALVLAVVMAFSLMLTANAANPVKTFNDTDGITKEFETAADVLTGMKVFQGDEGRFRPSDSITRAEVAALIYRLATGDVDNNRTYMYADFGNFKDVNADDWFAGYVGYCANAGYILGHDGYFNPNDPVTGYQVLAMVLRAIGYDKNREFTGIDWETNVSMLSTQLGILNNVKTTQYGGTLYLPARRDVVADLLFQADAKVPMVTYTTAFGYQTTGMTGGVIGATTNPTLGLKIFGLTEKTGVIVGNQETGEKVTILGVAGDKPYTGWDSVNSVTTGPQTASWSAYNYPGTPVVDGTSVQIGSGAGKTGANDVTVDNSLYLKWTSGIDIFAHNVTFWYNGGENKGSEKGTSTSPRTVYAMFDNVKADTIVYAGDDVIAGGTTVAVGGDSSHPTLRAAIGNAGLTTSNNTAIFNNAFDRLSASHKTDDAASRKISTSGTKVYKGVNAAYAASATSGNASPNNLYKLISNTTNSDGNNVVDVIVALNIQSSKINGVDNVSPFKFVSAVDVDTANWEYLAQGNVRTSSETGFIAQAALVGDSVKTLGDYEIGYHITGTNPATGRALSSTETNALQTITGQSTFENAYFKLGAVGAKEGVVISYHNDAQNIPGSGWVILDDGTKLTQSAMYNTVQTSASSTSIPQQNNTINTANTQLYGTMTYRFYLDSEGKYVGAEPITGTEFVYGTYLDYSSALGTSTYTYRLVGVGMDGKMVTKDVSRSSTLNFQNTQAITNVGALTIGIPFRGDSAAANGGGFNSVQPGLYRGFAVNSNGVMNSNINNSGNAVNLAIPMETGTTSSLDTPVTITSTDAAIGAKLITRKAGPANDVNLFFTEGTKFILVSGTGTDTQKITVCNGISDLLGGNRQVTINFTGTPKASYFTKMSGEQYSQMTVWSQSDYIYAQDATQISKQADVVFLPAEAVQGQGSNLYYVGDKTPLLTNAYGENATKYTMYVDGEKGEYWVIGLAATPEVGTYANRDANQITNVNTSDTFYTLTDTGKKANDGQPIYAVDIVTARYDTSSPVGSAEIYRATAGIIEEQNYVATTMNSQTALIGSATLPLTSGQDALYKVTGAKVVNLNNASSPVVAAVNTGNVWPGITDLATLNQASSLSNTQNQVPVRVSCVVSDDGLSVTTIYVCYDQNNT